MLLVRQAQSYMNDVNYQDHFVKQSVNVYTELKRPYWNTTPTLIISLLRS